MTALTKMEEQHVHIEPCLRIVEATSRERQHVFTARERSAPGIMQGGRGKSPPPLKEDDSMKP